MDKIWEHIFIGKKLNKNWSTKIASFVDRYSLLTWKYNLANVNVTSFAKIQLVGLRFNPVFFYLNPWNKSIFIIQEWNAHVNVVYASYKNASLFSRIFLSTFITQVLTACLTSGRKKPQGNWTDEIAMF